MFILVSMGNYINTDEVRFVISYNGSTVSKELYKTANAEGRLVNLTRGRAVKSLLVYKDNMVVAAPVKASTVIKKLNNSFDISDKEFKTLNDYIYEPDDDYSD